MFWSNLKCKAIRMGCHWSRVEIVLFIHFNRGISLIVWRNRISRTNRNLWCFQIRIFVRNALYIRNFGFRRFCMSIVVFVWIWIRRGWKWNVRNSFWNSIRICIDWNWNTIRMVLDFLWQILCVYFVICIVIENFNLFVWIQNSFENVWICQNFIFGRFFLVVFFDFNIWWCVWNDFMFRLFLFFFLRKSKQIFCFFRN